MTARCAECELPKGTGGPHRPHPIDVFFIMFIATVVLGAYLYMRGVK